MAPRTQRKTVRRTPKMMQAAVAPVGPEFGTDDELGIGAEDEAPAVSLDALMSHPDLAKLIDAAVEARVRQMGAVHAPQTSGSEAAFNAFLSRFEHLVEVRDEQRPGYIKPLTADEVDSRARGRVEMLALLKRFKADNVWPHYLLGDIFYGPSPNGPILYEAGQEIKTRLPPADHFRPLNEPAVEVYGAYKRWVGEIVPVEDLVAQAAADARGVSLAPEVSPELATLDPEVMLVDAPVRDISPQRVLGTLTPELRGKTMPRQPGVAPQPAGPIFADA